MLVYHFTIVFHGHQQVSLSMIGDLVNFNGQQPLKTVSINHTLATRL